MAKSIKEDIECYWFHKWNNWLIQIIPFKSIVWRKFRKLLFRSFQFICRVPQGSILGPSMFLMFVNEMLQAVKSNLFLNSDDSCLAFWGQDVIEIEKQLNKDFSNICGWFVDFWIARNTVTWKLLPSNSKNFFQSSYHKQHWQYKSYY